MLLFDLSDAADMAATVLQCSTWGESFLLFLAHEVGEKLIQHSDSVLLIHY